MRVPADAIFHEDDGTVYMVVNWRGRRSAAGVPGEKRPKAQLLRLAPRHVKLYRRQLEAGRSPKTIFYLIARANAKAAEARSASRPRRTAATERVLAETMPAMVEVPLDVLTKEQLVEILGRTLGEPVPYLGALTVPDLRHLHGRITRAMLG